MKTLRFEDKLILGKAKVLTDSLNLVDDVTSSGKQARLVVKIRATHSGTLQNNRVYPGNKMKDATHTWIQPYKRPILVAHNQYDGDPLGRVIAAEYHQLKFGDDFAKDYRKPDTGEDLGSGFIVLTNAITDKDAIAKILDGRYDTVSTAHTTTQALCSICGQDWLSMRSDSDEELCNHRPGKKYTIEDKQLLCYLIGGDMEYREMSYVNIPAQRNVKTLSMNIESLEDSMTGNEESKPFVSYQDGSFNELCLVDTEGQKLDLILRPGQKDEIPSKYKNLTSTVVSFGDANMDSIFDVAQITETAAKVVEEKLSTKQPETTEKTMDKSELNKKETPVVVTPAKVEAPIVEPKVEIDTTVAPVVPIEPVVTSEPAPVVPLLPSDETDAMISIAKSLTDAGLVKSGHPMADRINELAALFTTKVSDATKELVRGSTFCGPDKSFPVVSKDYAEAAKKLLDATTLNDQQKSRVSASINRKLKSLSDTVTANTEAKPTDNKPAQSNDNIVKAQEIIEKLTKERDTLLDNNKRLQSNLDAKHTLCDELTKENTKLKADLIRDSARQLAICRVNLGKPGTSGINTKEKFDAYVDELSARSIESILDALSDILPEIDSAVRQGGTCKSSLYQENKAVDPTVGKRDLTGRHKDNADDISLDKKKALIPKADFLKGI